MPRRPPGEMDAPLALVSRVSSLGPTGNGNGGNTIGPVVILSFFCTFVNVNVEHGDGKSVTPRHAKQLVTYLADS
jgi:hypothetical protein